MSSEKVRIPEDQPKRDILDIDLITPTVAANLIDKYGDEMSDDFKKWLLVDGNPFLFEK